MELFKIKPVFKEMIWGGKQMRERYHFDIPSDHTGEAWVVSAHKNGDGIIENGRYAGQTLASVYSTNRALFGKGSNTNFPLLIKIIDAKQDLSVQVHPEDAYAKIHENSYGKTECWYVLDCPIKTEMIIGHDLKTKEELKNAIENGLLETKLNKFEVKKGDFFYIPARTIHAICKNSLIYEVQQNSDITYRVFDYNRVDDKGNHRQLHIADALEVTQIPYVPYITKMKTIDAPNIKITELVNEEYFSVKKADCIGPCEFDIEDEFLIIGCIEGNTEINGIHIRKGEHVIVPNPIRKLNILGICTLIISAPKEALL